MQKRQEANFDGLVGPTHHFAGLSLGNTASTSHKGAVSHPKKAALQGLDKMKRLYDLGLLQGIIPPLYRPSIKMLERLGFNGSEKEILEKAWREDPNLVSSCSSSSSMWCANSGIFTPSCDSSDGKVHFTPANLITHFHRAIEKNETAKLFSFIFQGQSFVHHPPLPSTIRLADEGAANHIRLSHPSSSTGVHLFVWGQGTNDFPGRQTLDANKTIARIHGIKNPLFFEQTPEAIQAGVFHNDVISTGHKDFFLYHEKAFIEPVRLLEDKFLKTTGQPLKTLRVLDSELSLEEAVATYLFNSQLISTLQGKQLLLAPLECERHPKTKSLISYWIADPKIPIDEVIFFDLGESMKNGGGPACLRIRVELKREEQNDVHPSFWLNADLYEQLGNWIEKHYRETLHREELKSDKLAKEAHDALKELYKLLNINGGFLC